MTTKVFISYSHQDEAWKDRVQAHLGVLAQEGLLSVWEDRQIRAGQAWQPDIRQAIDECGVALLLISPHFLNSAFILGQEVPALLERRREQGIRVVPVILRPCAWHKVSWLQEMQARPRDGKALSGMSEHDADVAMARLAEEVASLLEDAAAAVFQAPPPASFRPAHADAPPSDRRRPPLETADRRQAPIDAFDRRRPPSALKRRWDATPRLYRYLSVPLLLVLTGTPAGFWLAHLAASKPPAAAEARPAAPALPAQWNNAPNPKGGQFVGRAQELAELDKAWQSLADKQPRRVVVFTAWGGFGKTTLARQWLYLKEKDGWPGGRGAEAVFWWSFGADADIDGFILEAIGYFRDRPAEPGEFKTDQEKLRALREAINGRRYVLVLDGLEPALRMERGEAFGKAQSPLLGMLLKESAAGQLGPGLALVTSSLVVADLAEHPNVLEISLEQHRLDSASARLLLRNEGVAKASDAELNLIAESFGYHPLALKTLAGLLKDHNGGKAAGWEAIVHEDNPQKKPEGREAERPLWRILSWYDRNLEPDELSLMQVLAHFREPVDEAWAKALLIGPDGLAPPQAWTVAALHDALGHLKDMRLLELGKEGRYGMHPLAAEHFRITTLQSQPIHDALFRLYAQTIANEPYPNTLEGLHPLYEAVYHGCQAGRFQQALDEVYIRRIHRGNAFFSARKLGAFSADLQAARQFFDPPWKQVAPSLTPPAQAFLYNEAAIGLRTVGRLEEALTPMRASLDLHVKQANWPGAAYAANNMGELDMALGRIPAAVEQARLAMDYADRGGDATQRMERRAALGYALHQQGAEAEALRWFGEAETMRPSDSSGYPLLTPLQGFQYADWLLTGAERQAWAVFLSPDGRSAPGQPLLKSLAETRRRVQQALVIEMKNDWLVNIALNYLSLGRIALYDHLLDGQPVEPARRHLDAAVDGLRKGGVSEFLVSALMTRAWLRAVKEQADLAKADLDEAWAIAEPGSMRLHQADIQLARARLFFDRDALGQARALVDATGYGRRRPELQAAEAALASAKPP